MDDHRKIIEKEIQRLKRAYKNAQDRYAFTGSSSTDRTMYKYSVLQDALEKSLAGPNDEEQRLMSKIEYLRRNEDAVRQYVRQLERDHDLLPGYAGKIIMLLEGRR